MIKGKVTVAVVVLTLVAGASWLALSAHESAVPSPPVSPPRALSNVSTASVAMPSVPVIKPAENLASIQQQLEQLAHCEQYKNCPQGTKDAYEGEYLRQRQMADLLAKLASTANQQPQNEAALRQLAGEYLSWPDGHVQSAALSVLSALPAQPANVGVITNALKECFDAPLMRQAMQELQRYPAGDAQITAFFSQNLQTGSMYAAQEIAQGLLPFLTADNVELYRQVLAGLEQQTTKARLLQATLDEFNLQQSHG